MVHCNRLASQYPKARLRATLVERVAERAFSADVDVGRIAIDTGSPPRVRSAVSASNTGVVHGLLSRTLEAAQ